MYLVGRSAELAVLDALLAGAVDGVGGAATVVGPPGSGRSALLAAISERARRSGWQVFAGAPVRASPGLSLWVSLLDDMGAPAGLTEALLGQDGRGGANEAVRWLISGRRCLIVIDDLDLADAQCLALLRQLVGRLLGTSTEVICAACADLGIGREVRLEALTEVDCTAMLSGVSADSAHAVWAVSGGLPGVARQLVGQLAGRPDGRDPLVHPALRAEPRSEFLSVDDALVQLLEMALLRTDDDTERARLLARLSRELLGDPLSGRRRRALSDEALALARRGTTAMRWPRSSMRGCMPCGIRRERRIGWPRLRKLWALPRRQAINGRSAGACFGSSWP